MILINKLITFKV